MTEDNCKHYSYLKEGDINTVKCIYCGHEEPVIENEMIKK